MNQSDLRETVTDLVRRASEADHPDTLEAIIEEIMALIADEREAAYQDGNHGPYMP